MENLDTYIDERMWRAKLDDRKDYKSRLVGRVWDFHSGFFNFNTSLAMSCQGG